eukprot:scaffold2250_cov399-Prasinococcus_capsulatus_cf.AAC.17
MIRALPESPCVCGCAHLEFCRKVASTATISPFTTRAEERSVCWGGIAPATARTPATTRQECRRAASQRIGALSGHGSRMAPRRGGVRAAREPRPNAHPRRLRGALLATGRPVSHGTVPRSA